MNICLYGASSSAIDRSYILGAETVGELIAKRGHTLIFGGGAQGVMGAAARGAARFGGRIIGVAPSFFNVDGVLYEHCTELIYTDTMRERKQKMEELADAFLVMPGGVGTFEEFFEIFTLKQIGRHSKAIVMFNQNGYYDAVRALFEKAIEERFMTEKCRLLSELFTEPDEMLDFIERYGCECFGVSELKNI